MADEYGGQGLKVPPEYQGGGGDASLLGNAGAGAATGAAFGPWGAAAGAGIGLLGGLMQNSSAKKQAVAQMQFQERMSSTAHQREVADLKAAGLNPILSGMGGQGATTAQGAAAPIGNALGEGINKGVEVATAQSAIRAQNQQTELLQAQTSQAREAARGTQLDNTDKSLRLKYGDELYGHQARLAVFLSDNEAEKIGLTQWQKEHINNQIKLTQQQTKTEEKNTEYMGYKSIGESWRTSQAELERALTALKIPRAQWESAQHEFYKEYDKTPLGKRLMEAIYNFRGGVPAWTAGTSAHALDEIVGTGRKVGDAIGDGLGLKLPRRQGTGVYKQNRWGR